MKYSKTTRFYKRYLSKYKNDEENIELKTHHNFVQMEDLIEEPDNNNMDLDKMKAALNKEDTKEDDTSTQ